jgi:2-(1,2-epoxy-1,2-dihydrophenyl)acetyl-CoA isomerase
MNQSNVWKDVLFEKRDRIATLTLNRPERFNAYSPEMRAGIARTIDDVANDEDISVLVITGAGDKGFCTGYDWRLRASQNPADIGLGNKYRLDPLGWISRWVYQLKKITIAAVNGVAAGGGAGLALSCDFRIASENARFSTAFIKRGLVVDTGIAYFLPRLVGLTKALEISLSGDVLDAREAEHIGLVSKVVPADKLMEATNEFAARFTKMPSVALQLTKRLIYKGLSLSLEDTLDYESYFQLICFQTDDVKEGIKSFLEKREPKFTGKFPGLDADYLTKIMGF